MTTDTLSIPPPPPGPAHDLRQSARDMGLRPDHPEAKLLDALANATAAVERHAALPMEDLQRATRQAAARGMQDAARALQRHYTARTWAIAVAAGAALVVVAYGGGWVTGWEARGAAQDGAAAQLAQLAGQCAKTAYQQSGGTACSLRLWVQPPPAE